MSQDDFDVCCKTPPVRRSGEDVGQSRDSLMLRSGSASTLPGAAIEGIVIDCGLVLLQYWRQHQ